jgi:hypothetical protein
MSRRRALQLTASVPNVLAQNPYRPLPQEAETLCARVDAPPRLVAHLILVHDVAFTLVERIAEEFPDLRVGRELILFGAAAHDLGKAIIREELIKPGSLHEARGVCLLESLGVPKEQARFAFTHGNWKDLDSLQIEDLLVALADKCWKGKRVDDLETTIVALLSKESGQEIWQCYSILDEIVQELATNADSRLAWQMSFPVV